MFKRGGQGMTLWKTCEERSEQSEGTNYTKVYGEEHFIRREYLG